MANGLNRRVNNYVQRLRSALTHAIGELEAWNEKYSDVGSEREGYEVGVIEPLRRVLKRHRGNMPTLKERWQAILDCDCNTRGTWCSDCCDNFGAIGDALDEMEKEKANGKRES